MFRKFAKYLVYTLAGVIILAAVAVGLLRILLPQLPEYQEEIEARLTAAVGRQVSFARLDARWRLRGPEIVFHDAAVADEAGPGGPVFNAATVSVGLSASELLVRRRVQVRRIDLDEIELAVDRSPGGAWAVQGMPLDALRQDGDSPSARGRLPVGRDISVSLSDVRIVFTDRLLGTAPVGIEVPRLVLDIAGRDASAQGRVTLGGGDSGRLSLDISGRFDERSADGLLSGDWRLSARLRDIVFGDLAGLVPAGWHVPVRGTGDASLALEVAAGIVRSALVEFDLAGMSPPGDSDLADVSGRLEWQLRDDGWLVSADDVDVRLGDRDWARTFLRLQASRADGRQRLQFGAGPVPLGDAAFFARFGPSAWSETLAGYGLSGTLLSLSGAVAGVAPDAAEGDAPFPIDEYDIEAMVRDLALAPIGRAPGVRGLTGDLRATPEGGRFELSSDDLSLRMPALFTGDVPVGNASATIVWRQSSRGLSILSDAVEQASDVLQSTSSLELQLPNDGSAMRIDLRSDWRVPDVAAIDPYLPDAKLKPKLVSWLSEALVEGAVENGRFLFTGELGKFPFEDGDGTFAATADARGVTMRFAEAWPAISDLDARIELDGLRLFTSSNSGSMDGLRFADAAVEFPRITTGELRVRADEALALPDLLRYAGDSPLRRLFGSQFDRIRVSGDARASLDLTVPLKAIKDYTIDAALSTESARVSLDGLKQSLTDLNGRVEIDRRGASGDGLTGTLLGEPVRIAVAPVPDPASRYGTEVVVAGTITGGALADDLGLNLGGGFAGAAAYDAVVRFPRANPDTGEPAPLLIRVTSPLEGLGAALPYPAGKLAEASAPMWLEFALGETISFSGNLDRVIDVDGLLDRSADDGRWRLDRATVHVGPGAAILPIVPGVFIDGRIDRLRLNDWLDLFAGRTADGTGAGLNSAALRVGQLFAFGQRVDDVSVSVNRAPRDWLVQVQSEAITGAISVPTDLRGGRPVILEMERFRLLEADPEAEGAGDPSAYPPIIVRADQFDIGARSFGTISAIIDKAEDGLVASKINTAAPEFTMTGSGQWTTSAVDPLGSRTALTLDVSSSDVSGMMARLGYAPGIIASDLEATVDVSWSGGPSADFIESLDGEVSMRIAEGRLDEVDPGAGRVVGLMSVAALPRRLALDFRDVFQKGLSFDEISGDFRIVNGEAYTCNTSLKSSVADIGLIGRASLARRNYNQTAIVSANVGNTLPAVGAVVAGPQAAAALLLFSQIFKKPLQGLGQAYYQINGSWDEPSIERTQAERFDATSQMAGCLIDVNE